MKNKISVSRCCCGGSSDPCSSSPHPLLTSFSSTSFGAPQNTYFRVRLAGLPTIAMTASNSITGSVITSPAIFIYNNVTGSVVGVTNRVRSSTTLGGPVTVTAQVVAFDAGAGTCEIDIEYRDFGVGFTGTLNLTNVTECFYWRLNNVCNITSGSGFSTAEVLVTY